MLTYLFCTLSLTAQEKDISGFEFQIDQDYLADFLRNDSIKVDKNYAISMRLGLYGEYANHPYLGLPWVREKADAFLIDKLLYNSGFIEYSTSHSFVFTINGFSPQHISDEIPRFQEAIDEGYALSADRPFSSFTGFRSTRRVEGFKRFAHSAIELDLAVTTSFTFGFASLGIVKGVENLFGSKRPDGNLWTRDETKPYPTGQINPAPIPMFMYSISAEAVVFRPIKKVVFQVRPELNLGYYTNLGIGLDIGKVMNVERHVDNLSYTDTNNPGLIAVNNDNLSLAISAGFMARVIGYNQHLQSFAKHRTDNYTSTMSVNRFVLEGYIGAKIQLFKKVEFNFSINRRTPEFNTESNTQLMWGTFGMKYLIAPEGEGCYD